ncbi:MAG: hypothetical protein L0312_26090 [Acidobacteria bacterium]|nr:hypothetical protein [Acidobacteriota bacterium]
MKTNETLKNSLSAWQEYTQAYTDFVLNTTEEALKNSFALRERVDGVVAEAVKQAQTLSAQEQDIVLQAAESFQAQTLAASRRIAKLFGAPSAS